MQRNINELNKLKIKAPQNADNATKKRVDEIIKLYTERKLANVATAENYIKGLPYTDKKINMTKHFKNTKIISNKSRRKTTKSKNDRNKSEEGTRRRQRIQEERQETRQKHIFSKFSIIHY